MNVGRYMVVRMDEMGKLILYTDSTSLFSSTYAEELRLPQDFRKWGKE
jgi:hypothetical protein